MGPAAAKFKHKHAHPTFHQQDVKLVVVGDGAVGKTCALVTYSTGKFVTDYIPTIFDNTSVFMQADGVPVNLSLFDTAGQEDYAKMRSLSYSNVDLFLVMFSCINTSSYRNIGSVWVKELPPEVPFFLVGTMIDCRSDPETWERMIKKNEKALLPEDGEALAKEIGAVG